MPVSKADENEIASPISPTSLHRCGHTRDSTDTTIKGFTSKEPTGTAAEPLNIVILGASFAGLSCAHHFLDFTINRLRTTPRSPTYRLIIISPSTHFYWTIGAPRALVKAGLIKHDESFIPIEPGFHRHRGHQFDFMQATCTSMNLEERTVTIECADFEAQKRASLISPGQLSLIPGSPAIDPRTQKIPYHALLCCTGSSANSPLLSLHGSHLKTMSALDRIHADIREARTIVVCGGGTSGVETAGQLATFLSYKRRFPTRIKHNKSKHAEQGVFLITGAKRCLAEMTPKISADVENLLHSVGVRVMHDARFAKVELIQHQFQRADFLNVKLDNGAAIEADVYIDCTGVTPNSAYTPPHIRDEKGYILTNNKTLRVDAAGPRVYAIGDVASYSKNSIPDVYAGVPVAMQNLLNDLLAHEYRLQNPYTTPTEKLARLVDDEYVDRPKDSRLCPITKYRGAGTLKGHRLPKLAVWWLKGRDYRLGKAKAVVVEGGNPYKTSGKGGRY